VNIRLREVLKLDYKCPRGWLRELREIERVVSLSGLPYKVRSLRTRRLRRWNESRQAALFAYGISQRYPDLSVDFACTQHADYDAIIRSRRHDEEFFTPIQLKEYVPGKLNPEATLESLLEGLNRYTNSSDLVAVVYLNRRFRLRLNPIYCPGLNLGGVYLLGGVARNRWILVGDLLDEFAGVSYFDHP
jgi:hypothetical protein